MVKLRWVSYAIIISAFVFVVISAIVAQSCPIPNYYLTEDQLRQKAIPNCFEFWLNRYQTILGVFAAIAAGWLTWRGAKRQADVANQQRALSLIPVVKERMEAMRGLKITAKKISRTNKRFMKNVDLITSLSNTLSSANIDYIQQRKIRNKFTNQLNDYSENHRNLQNHISYMRVNRKPALLRFKVQEALEDYLEIVSIDNNYNGRIIEDLGKVIEFADWNDFSREFGKFMQRFADLPPPVDLSNHPIHNELTNEVAKSEILLEHALDESHRA